VKDFLLLTRLTSIRGIDFNRDSTIEARPPIVPARRTTISDSVFDYEEKTVYFYGQRSQMIYSSKMGGEKPIPCIPVVPLTRIRCGKSLPLSRTTRS
ncbi:unnamed protein product, partial [Rotaria sp. Silwood1]